MGQAPAWLQYKSPLKDLLYRKALGSSSGTDSSTTSIQIEFKFKFKSAKGNRPIQSTSPSI